MSSEDKKIQDSPGNANISQADKSDITTPTEDEIKYQKLKHELGIDALQERIEEQATQQDGLIQEIQKTNESITLIAQNLQPQQPQNTAATSGSPVVDMSSPEGMNRIADIATLIEKGANAYAIATGKTTQGGMGGDIMSQLVNNLVNSFVKLQQIQIDDALMRTYPNFQKSPPAWATEKPKQPGVKVE